MHTPFTLLSRRFGTLVFSGVVGMLLSLGASLLFPLEYRADAQLLIISRSRYGVDPYTVVKSAERIGENLVQVVETNDFYQKVMTQPNHTIDRSRFENVSERTKRKRWQKAVDASVVYGTGVLSVSGYHTNPDQALELARVAAIALVKQGPEYVGGDVTMKVVNDPVTTRLPARPNLPVNAIAGFVVGALVSGLFITLRHSKE